MAELIFREETHQYFLDGVELPSITRVLAPLKDFSHVHPELLERACLFGQAVHKTVELYLADDLVEEGLDPNLADCLEAFRQWERDSPDLRAPVVERPMAHQRLGYAGTPDLIYDGQAIVEIKTRDYDPLCDPIQTAAQEQLWLANGGTKGAYRRFVLTLRPGGYALKACPKKGGWERFRYLLDFYKMQQQIHLWK